MIAAHRRRHRAIFRALAVLLPLLLFLALRARPRWPRLEVSPPGVDEFKETNSGSRIEAVTLFRGNGVGG